MRRSLLRRALACVLLAFLFSADLSAQHLAKLNVNITDPSGGIPQAQVMVKNVETRAKRSDVSNAAGLAVIPGLVAGSYELTVEAAQFSEYRANLTLTVGQIASLPVSLGVNTVREQVEVREAAEGIDTQKPEVSQFIERQKIAGPPIAGRGFIDFVPLTRGANVGRSMSVCWQSPFHETVLERSFAGLRETHSAFSASTAWTTRRVFQAFSA
jgi:hypothetical protein